MKLMLLSGAFAAGIVLGAFLPLRLYVPLFSVLPLALLLLLRRRLSRRAHAWAGASLLLLLAGLLRAQLALTPATLPIYAPAGEARLEGVVARDPIVEEGRARLTLDVERLDVSGAWRAVSGSVLVYTGSLPAYAYGDRLEVWGELREPPQFEDFDYRAFLAEQGIYFVVYDPHIAAVGTGWVAGLRQRLSLSLSSSLHEPQAALAEALLLGRRASLPPSLMDAFRRTGTAHLVAISGLHVAILGGMALGAGAWLFGRRRPTYLVVTLALVWLYVLLTGLRPPALRSAIMFSFYPVGLWLGRPHSSGPSLAFAGALMAGMDPRAPFDVSFQLSFAAVAGVLLALSRQHLIQEWLAARLGEERWGAPLLATAAGGVAVSLGAGVATFPLIAYYFHYFSPLGLAATPLALLALPAIILASLATGALGLLVPLLGQVAGWLAWLSLSYVIFLVQALSLLPFASFRTGEFSGAWVWLYYGMLAGVLLMASRRASLRRMAARAVAWRPS